ncbi:unnamed protein product [Diplocarpon coronariae]
MPSVEVNSSGARCSQPLALSTTTIQVPVTASYARG